MRRVLQSILNSPWAITQSGLEGILEIASRTMDRDYEGLKEVFHARPKAAVALNAGVPIEGTDATIRGNVAVLPIDGPIFKGSSLFSQISGATSAQSLAADLSALDEDPMVKAIVLDVDSPGGEIAGLMELTALMRGLGTPTVAHVGGMAASAAFHIISAADQIVLSESAMVGSIGVVMSATDRSEAMKAAGVKRIEIVSSQSPMKRAGLDTEDGKAEAQKMVDAQAAVMINDIAANMGISPETVASDFGRGGMFIAREAVKAGMADSVGSFESVIARLQSESPAHIQRMEASVSATEEKTATTPHPEALTADYLVAVAPEAVVALQAKGAEVAATAERKRIFEILDLEAVGQNELKLALAKDAGMDVGTAAKKINEAIGASALKDLEEAEEGIDLESGIETDETSQAALVQRIMNAGK